MKRTITLLSALLLVVNSYATIHYTYVGDEITTDRYYDIDNNGDQNFHFAYEGGSDYTIDPTDTFNYMAIDGQNLCKAYTFGAGLGTYTWSPILFGFTISSPLDYFLQEEKYVMVKFMVDGDAYYGWFLLGNTNQAYNMYVISYAWSDVPNQLITAGEGNPNDVQEVLANPFLIHQQNDQIQILTPGDYTASITGLNGQVIMQQQVTAGRIDTAIVPRGIYILTLTDKRNRVMHRKILV